MAVVDGAMPVMKEAVVGEQIAKLHALVAFVAPWHLMAGTSPVLLGKDRPTTFAHLAVKAGVVSDHHGGIRSHRAYGRVINALASHVGVRDAGQARDLGRDRLARLMELVERFEHPVDAAACAVLELDDAKLDHLVARVIDARGLCVEDQPDERRLAWRISALNERSHPSQHPVLTGALKHARDAVEGVRH